jgi:hypothetical protein
VVILANVPVPAWAALRELERFVSEGGGMLITLGSLTPAEQYDQAMYRESYGLLPAELHAGSSESARPVTLGNIDTSHPVFSFMRGRPDLASSASVTRFMAASPGRGEARTLASYSSGEPFLIERIFGRGRVLLMTTTVDADWNALPLSSSYLPMMQSIVRYLARGSPGESNLRPGQPIEATFAAPGGPGPFSATINAPIGPPRVIELARAGDRLEVRYAQTQVPGRYVLRGPNPDDPARYFVVRDSHAESDLSPMTAQRWKSLEDALQFRRIAPDRSTISQAIAAQRAGRELFLPLLGCVVLLALAELLLTRWWGS